MRINPVAVLFNLNNTNIARGFGADAALLYVNPEYRESRRIDDALRGFTSYEDFIDRYLEYVNIPFHYPVANFIRCEFDEYVKLFHYFEAKTWAQLEKHSAEALIEHQMDEIRSRNELMGNDGKSLDDLR